MSFRLALFFLMMSFRLALFFLILTTTLSADRNRVGFLRGAADV